MSEKPLPRVDVWQQAPGAWRWRYVVGEEEGDLELASNTPDPSRDAAVAAARLSYPGVPVHVFADHEKETTAAVAAVREPHALLWAGLTGSVSLVLVAAALRYRRWWVALAAPVVAAGVVSRLRRQLS